MCVFFYVGDCFWVLYRSLEDKHWYCFNDQTVSRVSDKERKSVWRHVMFYIIMCYRSLKRIYIRRLVVCTSLPHHITHLCTPGELHDSVLTDA